MMRYAARKYTKKQWTIALIIIVVVFVAALILADHPPESMSAEAESEASALTSQNDGYVTGAEYDQIKNGMTYDQVKAIIGGDGQNIFESGDKGTDNYQISYMWTGEKGGEATISFSGKDKLTVQLKSQSGLK